VFEKDLPGGRTAEFNKDAEIGALPLETCETMNNSWGFNLTDRRYKSTRDLVHYLVKAAGHGANFLLNVGPMPNGKIQPEFVERLKEVGRWMSAHGDSVYGTRGGPITPRTWGVTTQKGDTVFVHILDWDDSALLCRGSPAREAARLLADGRPLVVQQTASGLTCRLPERPRAIPTTRSWPGDGGEVKRASRGRVTAFAVAVALIAGGALASGGADLPEVKTRGALRVIIAADESPDTFALVAGTRPGFERDLMERFAQLQNIKLEVVRAPGYADRVPMLLRGEGDVIAAIFDTPDRRERVAFTAEVIPTHNAAVTLPRVPHPAYRGPPRRESRGDLRRQPAEAAARRGEARGPHGLREDGDLLRGLKARTRSAPVPISGAGAGLEARWPVWRRE
jgi:hypothetical protein